MEQEQQQQEAGPAPEPGGSAFAGGSNGHSCSDEDEARYIRREDAVQAVQAVQISPPSTRTCFHSVLSLVGPDTRRDSSSSSSSAASSGSSSSSSSGSSSSSDSEAEPEPGEEEAAQPAQEAQQKTTTLSLEEAQIDEEMREDDEEEVNGQQEQQQQPEQAEELEQNEDEDMPLASRRLRRRTATACTPSNGHKDEPPAKKAKSSEDETDEGDEIDDSEADSDDEEESEEEQLILETRLRRRSVDKAKLLIKEQQEIKRRLSKILKKSATERSADEKLLLRKNPKLRDQVNKNIKKQKRAVDRMKEVEDAPSLLAKKCATLAKAIQKSKHMVVYTGAGISTSANIPDYRGPNGVWTLLDQGKEVAACNLELATPTYTHMALFTLYKRGKLKHIVSQNCDGLHMRSGIPRYAISEIHGNMFIEVCKQCRPNRPFIRRFDVTERTNKNRHTTLRRCYVCGASLYDTIVHFGERGSLKWPINWSGASRGAEKADTILCLGSSLKVLRRYTWLWAMDRPKRDRPKLFIVNLQWTPKDSCATLKINGRCDEVMRQLMQLLEFSVPEYWKDNDPLLSIATPLNTHEMHTTTKKDLITPIAAVNNSEEKAEEEKKPLDLKPETPTEVKVEPPDSDQVNGKSAAPQVKEETHLEPVKTKEREQLQQADVIPAVKKEAADELGDVVGAEPAAVTVKEEPAAATAVPFEPVEEKPTALQVQIDPISVDIQEEMSSQSRALDALSKDHPYASPRPGDEDNNISSKSSCSVAAADITTSSAPPTPPEKGPEVRQSRRLQNKSRKSTSSPKLTTNSGNNKGKLINGNVPLDYRTIQWPRDALYLPYEPRFEFIDDDAVIGEDAFCCDCCDPAKKRKRRKSRSISESETDEEDDDEDDEEEDGGAGADSTASDSESTSTSSSTPNPAANTPAQTPTSVVNQPGWFGKGRPKKAKK